MRGPYRLGGRRPTGSIGCPLCGYGIEILDTALTLGVGTSPFVFFNWVGTQPEEKQLRRLLRKLQIAAVPHGFRLSFRDWVAEETDHPREVIGSGPRACGPEQGRGGLSAHGPVRAPASAHARLGEIPSWRDVRSEGRFDCFRSSVLSLAMAAAERVPTPGLC